MSTLNLTINTIAFNDQTKSNNPSIRIFDLTYKLLGASAQKPKSEDFSIAPGETLSVFNGTRTTAIDGTTAFDVTKTSITENRYRFTHSAGTAPVFRTNRVPAVDNTTQLNLTVNGPIATITYTAGTPLDTTNIIVGDILNVLPLAGFSQSNQGRFTIIAKTSTSISFENLNAAAQAVTIATASDFLIYSSGGSTNQIQIGDKLVISAGFSQATQGTYSVDEVTPEWFEILIGSPNGIPLETGIIPGAAGLVFYKSAKSFVMIAAQNKCSVRINADASDNSLIEPTENNNPEKPGLYIKHGTCYALSIKNLSLETMEFVIATAE